MNQRVAVQKLSSSWLVELCTIDLHLYKVNVNKESQA